MTTDEEIEELVEEIEEGSEEEEESEEGSEEEDESEEEGESEEGSEEESEEDEDSESEGESESSEEEEETSEEEIEVKEETKVEQKGNEPNSGTDLTQRVEEEQEKDKTEDVKEVEKPQSEAEETQEEIYDESFESLKEEEEETVVDYEPEEERKEAEREDIQMESFGENISVQTQSVLNEEDELTISMLKSFRGLEIRSPATPQRYPISSMAKGGLIPKEELAPKSNFSIDDDQVADWILKGYIKQSKGGGKLQRGDRTRSKDFQMEQKYKREAFKRRKERTATMTRTSPHRTSSNVPPSPSVLEDRFNTLLEKVGQQEEFPLIDSLVQDLKSELPPEPSTVSLIDRLLRETVH